MPELKTASTRRAKRRDKLARWVITLGGATVIASVIAILALIVGVTLPLFRAARASVACVCPLPTREFGDASRVLRVGIDASLDGRSVTGFVWSANGSVGWVDLRSGKLTGQDRVPPPGGAKSTLRSVEPLGDGKYSLCWSDGAAALVEIAARRTSGKDAKTAPYAVRSLAQISTPLSDKKLRSAAAVGDATVRSCFIRRSNNGAITRAALLSNGTIALLRQATTETPMGDEEVSTHESVLRDEIVAHVCTMTMDREGNTLYAGTDNGRLLRWRLDEKGEAADREVVRAYSDGRAITALALVLGDVSLAVGDAKGELTVWSPINSDGTRKLQAIHQLMPHRSAIREILPSGRNKSLLSLDADGVVHLDHTTSERHLLTISLCGAGVPPAKKKAGEMLAPQKKAGETPAPQKIAGETPALRIGFGLRGDALLELDAAGRLTAWQIESGYPEISLKTLFGKVQYEGYDQPEYTWQTTGGEDFEAKFSLVPLIFGTLKGTFYSMLFAVPLALFGAMYVSYFTTPAFRRWIKPLVEIMATVPSVVVGFLIALWLAPIIENWLFAFFVSLIAVPATFVVFMALWQLVRRFDWARRVENGYEFLAVLPILLLGVGIAVCLAAPLEKGLFGSVPDTSHTGTATSMPQPLTHGLVGSTPRWQILAFLTALFVIPVTLLVLRTVWRHLPKFNLVEPMASDRKRLAMLIAALCKCLILVGRVLFWLGGITLAAALAFWLAGLMETSFFPKEFVGNFRQWLFRGPLGMQYDQRNCIIIAFGLGFTVIPIIFSISEDSLSNVPYSMTAASMAVGASRWQTLWRVVLPSASPGIFAATMIGFGRAVGETMIVLMATGNTPILSCSPLNGMRTLSANIAVEIPEAPVGGTLYRVLFLCAVLLFVLTFTVNTAAELVRQRLRKRFGRF
ncbi:MAG: ABC transporter permease subunit [Thermoguttaceae bacterium]